MNRYHIWLSIIPTFNAIKGTSGRDGIPGTPGRDGKHGTNGTNGKKSFIAIEKLQRNEEDITSYNML